MPTLKQIAQKCIDTANNRPQGFTQQDADIANKHIYALQITNNK